MTDSINTTTGSIRGSEQAYGKQFSSNLAENYQRYFVPSIGAHVAADLIGAAALEPGERVLDIACGTGTVTRLAAERVGPSGDVAGLDVNPGMLDVARKETQAELPITWYESPAESIPLPDGSFDAVLCGMGLQFFGDRQAALREVRRVLVPGGRFVANLPGPTPPPFEIMAEEFARHIDAEGAKFVHAVFSLHEAEEIERLATTAGFGNVAVRSDFKALRLPPPAEFLWQYVYSTPLAAAVASTDEVRRQALENAFVTRIRKLLEKGASPGVKMSTLQAIK